MNKTIRALSMVLAILFVFGLLPIGSFPIIEETVADSGTISEDEVTSLINDFWKVTGKTKDHCYWNGGKKEREMKEAARARNWTFGTTGSPCKPASGQSHVNAGCKSNSFNDDAGQRQCYGFALWLDYAIFGSNPENWEKKYTIKKDYTLKPGDHLRVRGSAIKKDGKIVGYHAHSMVVWEVINPQEADPQVKIIECNVGGKCHINTRTFKMSELISKINQSSKYYVAKSPAIKCKHDKLDSNGNCTNPKCTAHFHKYNDNGVCTYCKDHDGKQDTDKDTAGLPVSYYNITNLKALMKPTSGVVTPKSTYFKVYYGAYDASGELKTAGTLVSSTVKATRAKILYTLENNHKNKGEKWYFVRIEKASNKLKKNEWYGTLGWVKASDVHEVMDSEITFTGVSEPAVNLKVGKSSLSVKGKFSTNNGATISEITAAIYDLTKLSEENKNKLKTGSNITAAEAYTLAKANACKSKGKSFQNIGHMTANASSVDLWTTANKKLFDQKLSFSHLAAGQYRYVITVTNSLGVSRTANHDFNVNAASQATVKYNVLLNVQGSVVANKEVIKGGSITPDTYDRPGLKQIGWSTDSDAEEVNVSIPYYPSNNNTTLFAVFEAIAPPAIPSLPTVEYDIAVGETQTVYWNAASGADKYIVYIWDENGFLFKDLETKQPSITIPFDTAGIYSISVAGVNGSEYGIGDESEQAVTITVHDPSTVTFMRTDFTATEENPEIASNVSMMNQNSPAIVRTSAVRTLGQAEDPENSECEIWGIPQDVKYGGSAIEPEEPIVEGYNFLGWSTDKDALTPERNCLSNVYEDRTLYPVYSKDTYVVLFYDMNGDLLEDGGRKTVAYKGSVSLPTPPTVEGYTFLRWTSEDDLTCVTKNGIKAYPVYLKNDAQQDNMPLNITITEVTQEDNGYWVYYTVSNNTTKAQMGRVVIAGKTYFGKFITQTESGAFYLRAQAGASYSGNAYVPVAEADMRTLAKVEAYVVESYGSTRPIASVATKPIETVTAGEYSGWMTQEQFDNFQTEYDPNSIETTIEYRFKAKIRQESDNPTVPEGYELERVTTHEGAWSEWSPWQDAAVAASDTCQVETQSVKVSDAHTEYRYGRWYGTNVVGAQSGKTFSAAASPAFAHANYNYKNASTKFSKNYSAWSTKRLSAISDTFHTSYHDSDKTYFKVSSGQYYWHIYYNGSQTAANKYFWEETRTVDAEYKTQYRFKEKAVDTYTYTFAKWSDWSTWSTAGVAANDDRMVETRTMYRVKLLSKNQDGTEHHFVAKAGADAAGKQAILTVYKVDEASDYSNQYIEQVTLDENGEYSFSFYTLEEPSVRTGDYTVSLAIEDTTNPLYVGTILAPKREYTVTFVDEITGNTIGVDEKVPEGGTAQAPNVPEKEGYYFLGWDYGLGNIREDMTITARFVEKQYTVVFHDPVNGTVLMKNDLLYGSPIVYPADPSAEGYTFLGWKVGDGNAPSTVEGHMIITAAYEHITKNVTFLDSEGAQLAQVTVNYGDYVPDIFGYEGEDVYFDDEENVSEPTASVQSLRSASAFNEETTTISEEMLNIPDSMYFAGWNEGGEDPVTGDLVLAPVLSYYDDTREIVPTLEGGIYVGPQTIQLFENLSDIENVAIQYRIVTNMTQDAEGNWVSSSDWIQYLPDSSQQYQVEDTLVYGNPDIVITESCILEIEASEPYKNDYSASYEYIIADASDVPASVTSVSAEQQDANSVVLSWTEVAGVDGYIVRRVSNDESEYGEISEESRTMVQGTSFVDTGMEPKLNYAYTVSSYVLVEQSGASILLESEPSSIASVFFYGDYTPVTSISIDAPEEVWEGSTTQLTAIVLPDDAYDSAVQWSVTGGTGDGYISEDGLFCGTDVGTVTITAKALDGSEKTASTTLLVKTFDTGVGSATLSVSSANTRAGGTTKLTVSISENSLLNYMQFSVLYDAEILELVSAERGAILQSIAPEIGTTDAGVVHFTWDSNTSLTQGGDIMELTFRAKANAFGDSLVTIPTGGTYRYIFGSDEQGDASVAPQNGMLTIHKLLLGDVNENDSINIVDASLVRRYTVKLVDLTETQLLAADVNGDGSVDVRDAHMIRRYIAHLLDAFPAA